MGAPQASEQVKAKLEAVGHTVEDGASMLKDALESVGDSVQRAGEGLSDSVASLNAPAEAASAPRGGPKIYEAPPRK